MSDEFAARVHALIAQWIAECQGLLELQRVNAWTHRQFAINLQSGIDARFDCATRLGAALAAALAPHPEQAE